MYYKVIVNDKVVDVLDRLMFAKYQLKHQTLLICDEAEANVLLSHDGENAWHLATLLPLPADNLYGNAQIEPIDEYEYDRLKALNLKTTEEIVENVLLELMERGVL